MSTNQRRSLLVAIDLPKNTKKMIGRLCCGLSSMEWIEEANLHISLRHLGNVEGTLEQEIKDSLANVHQIPFSLILKGIDYFGARGSHYGEFRLGIEKSLPFLEFKKFIDKSLSEVGIRLGKQASQEPHIVLGYMNRRNDDRAGSYLENHYGFECPPFLVEAFSLLSCQKTDKRTFYIEEATYPLSEGKPGALSREQEETRRLIRKKGLDESPL